MVKRKRSPPSDKTGRGDFLFRLAEQDVGDFHCGGGHVAFDDVAVVILCGRHAGVSQLLGDRYDIRSVGQQDRGQAVAEGVGINMGEIIPLAEVIHPLCEYIRADGETVVPGKDVARILPLGTLTQSQLDLDSTMLTQ